MIVPVFHLYRPLTLIGLTTLGICAGFYADASAPSWVRSATRVSKIPATKSAYEPFKLEVIRCDSGSLTAMGRITCELSGTDLNAPLVVDGVENQGRFWPKVRGEVSDSLEKGWREVTLTTTEGRPASRLIEPHTLGATVFFDLSAFRVHIGRQRYGRVVLADGENAAFSLDNLLAPGSFPKEWVRTADELHPSNAWKPFLTPQTERQRNTFTLLEIKSEAGKIIGYFGYLAASGRLRTEEESTAEEREVWPVATLEVSNDYHREWRPVGTASKPDQQTNLTTPPAVAMTLRIYLDDFKPQIGRFRYGKVTLATGDSETFELQDLLPPKISRQ